MNGRSLRVPDSLAAQDVKLVLVDFGDRRNLLPIRVVNVAGTWRVDPQPFVAAVKAALAVR